MIDDAFFAGHPVSVHFGRQVRRGVIDGLQGKSCLMVTSPRGRRCLEHDPFLSSWAAAPGHVWMDRVPANPSFDFLQESWRQLLDVPFDAVFAYGGGSVIDAAKVLNFTLTARKGAGATFPDLLAVGNAGYSIDDENAGDAENSESAKISGEFEAVRPLYALPTTSGTGSEVTPFATIWDTMRHRKMSLSTQAIFPRAAYVDPELTDGSPADISLFSGLDAVNQAIESICSLAATAQTIRMGTEALRLGLAALPVLSSGSDTMLLRDEMSACSLLAGLSISHTRTGLCHSISYPLTAHYGVPHGLACAFSMPAVIRLNMAADDGRLVRLTRELGYEDLARGFENFNGCLDVCGRIKSFVPSLRDLMALVDEMYTPGRADNCLASVDKSVISRLVEESWRGV